jgi:hypothetical protein
MRYGQAIRRCTAKRADLVGMLGQIGVKEGEHNLRDKAARGKFTGVLPAMRVSNWGSHFAVTGWIVAGILLALLISGVVTVGPTLNGVKASKERQQSQIEQQSANPGAPGSQEQPRSGKDKSACREGETNELCFQRRSAVAAEDQARATEDQALYTLLGLILLFFTLAATAAAAIAASLPRRPHGAQFTPWRKRLNASCALT